MPAPAALPSPMCQAALQYARRGWPVFPVRERDGEPYIDRKTGKEAQAKAKHPYIAGGLKSATTDERRIHEWWRRHPEALIGLPTGVNGCFVLDFDPRVEETVDEATGEVTTREWTLEQLKAELEAQMGCALPRSVTAITQSGGVHVYFRQPDGDAIRNRGNLPAHVDVRGQGGYVIAPPSVMAETGKCYRWLDRGDWRDDAAIADAPVALIEILRGPKRREPAPAAEAGQRPAGQARAADDAVRKYALSALDAECREIRAARSGARNAQLNESTFKIATLVAAGALDAGVARASIEAAARDNPGGDDDRQLEATIASGWTAGMQQPRDLAEVASASRSRRERGPPRGSRSSPPAPGNDDDGQPSSQPGGGGSGYRIGGDGGDAELTRGCAFLPQTDLGNLERFLKRHGHDFLHVEAWGWLAWDGKRWNRDMAMALLGRAIQDTMRAIQQEAELVRASGVAAPALEMFDASQLAAHEAQQRGKFDRIVKRPRNGDPVLLSDTISKWGRTSEGAGHIQCIAKMAEARLSSRPEDFDADLLKVNVLNGTIEFRRPDGDRQAQMRLVAHDRRDRMTKLAEVEYDAAAVCPLYDRFLGRVQPSAPMRAFLDTWAGYNMLGDVSAQKFALFYGEGSNGKSVWMDVKAFVLGDYSWVTGIETFIDQGKYRKGSDASPDIAAMTGRRMVRSSEPEEGSKFSDGLIKALTGTEPMPTRELNKPPFNMRVTFKATVAANNKPRIGTDHGIQRRMLLVPWSVIIPDDEVDLQLPGKLKAEAAGILNRMVEGALRYLNEGLVMPDEVREATREYHEENDILGQFLALCIERVPGETLGATPLHSLFAAWQTWANLLPQTGKPWSPKHLKTQMEKKRFKSRKSSSMLWDDIHPLFLPSDFVDEAGKPVSRPLPPPDRKAARAPPAPSGGDYDDDLPP